VAGLESAQRTSNYDMCECIGGGKIEPRTKEALERAYISLQEITADLYAEVDNAIDEGNYNDASLLQSQADRLYETLENLGIVIAEQEE
jgi:hypothetical protein